MNCCNRGAYYPPQRFGGFLIPFVGGLLIGGLAAPYFINHNKSGQYYTYPPNQQQYYPSYSMGSYQYPYANGFYHY